MRVMFAVYPAHAHLYPVVPCAWALQCAGHDVCVASFTGFSGPIAATGLTPVALGEPGSVEARFAVGAGIPNPPETMDRYADVMGLHPTDRDSWDVFYQFLLLACSDYLRLDRPEVADIMAFARSWQPDLVLWDPTFPIAALAARACGAAHARYLTGPDIFSWNLQRLAAHRDKLRAEGLEENPLGALVRPAAEQYGLVVNDELLLGQWAVDAMLADLRLPTATTTVPVRPVPYAAATVLPDWLYAPPDRPRVAVSLGVSTRQAMAGSHVRDEAMDGTLSPAAARSGEARPQGPAERPKIRMDAERERLAMLMDAVSSLDIEVIATLNEAQLAGLPTLPDNVRTIGYLPLPQLLRTSSALIHHGGLGTMAAASALQVPQLIFDTGGSTRLIATEQDGGGVEFVMPDKKMEATYLADYVIKRNAGARLNHRAQSASEMRDTVRRVLEDPSYREGAASIYRDWLATPSPNDIVPILEDLTAQYRSRS